MIFEDEGLPGVFVVIGTDADDLEGLVGVFFLKSLQDGNGFAARRAPSGPEIEKNDFALEAFVGDGRAFFGDEREVRSEGLASENGIGDVAAGLFDAFGIGARRLDVGGEFGDAFGVAILLEEGDAEIVMSDGDGGIEGESVTKILLGLLELFVIGLGSELGEESAVSEVGLSSERLVGSGGGDGFFGDVEGVIKHADLAKDAEDAEVAFGAGVMSEAIGFAVGVVGLLVVALFEEGVALGEGLEDGGIGLLGGGRRGAKEEQQEGQRARHGRILGCMKR